MKGIKNGEADTEYHISDIPECYVCNSNRKQIVLTTLTYSGDLRENIILYGLKVCFTKIQFISLL